MRATLDALGDARTVWVADSFQGFPVDEAGEHIDLSTYDFLAVPLEEVRENFARFGLRGRASASSPASSRTRSRRWPAGAGRSCGSTATPTRRP